jgi:hypothetical protein
MKQVADGHFIEHKAIDSLVPLVGEGLAYLEYLWRQIRPSGHLFPENYL